MLSFWVEHLARVMSANVNEWNDTWDGQVQVTLKYLTLDSMFSSTHHTFRPNKVLNCDITLWIWSNYIIYDMLIHSIFYRCVPDCVFYRNDFLWHPNFLPRGGHGAVLGGRWNDSCVSALSHVEGCRCGNNDCGLLPGYLLLCHYFLDVLLSVFWLQRSSWPSMGHMWYDIWIKDVIFGEV